MTKRFGVFGNQTQPTHGQSPTGPTKAQPPRIPTADEVMLARNQQQLRDHLNGAQTRMWCISQATSVAEKSPMSADDLIKLTEFFFRFVASSIDALPKTDKI